MKITLDTPIIELYRHNVAKLNSAMSRKLAVALGTPAAKTNVDAVTVEDLLNYFPARYEDRSNFLSIDQIEPGMEAAVELYVRNSGGIQVGKNRARNKPPLFIFEITGGDLQRQQKPVTVKWFVSGKGASDIVNWYRDRFPRGTRLVAYGLWDEDTRGQMFLKIAKPEEIEILPPAGTDADAFGLLSGGASESELGAIATGLPRRNIPTDADEENDGDPALATIHTGRVPIYRKLGPFQTKRLREIVHSVIAELDLT